MKKTIVIAEAGVNHNGDIRIAKALVDSAAKAGADFIKFQTFKADNLVRKDTPKSRYQIQDSIELESQYTMLKKLELSESMHLELIAYSKQRNIEFMSTAFDIDSVKMLHRFGQKFFKIPSGEITNLPYIRYIGSLRKRVILSSGMSNLKEVENAIRILEEANTPRSKIIVLHCTSSYPAPYCDVNLHAMKTLKDKLHVEVGYSDHTVGIQVALAAVALGARVIEKHFTIDKKLPGPDHKASLSSEELFDLVTSIRLVEESLGSKVKKSTKSERENAILSRKSIVAKVQIKKGDTFSEENLTTKRPATGISPIKWDSIIGKVSPRDFQIDDIIKW